MIRCKKKRTLLFYAYVPGDVCLLIEGNVTRIK
jgi:hypothetical protein